MRLALVLSVLAAGCSAAPAPEADLLVAPEVVVEPSLVVTDPPVPVVVEEIGEPKPLTVEQFEAMQELLRRNPNATQDELNAVIDAVPVKPCDCGAECNCEDCQCPDCPHKPDLPEHPGEPEVAELPEPPPAPEGSFLAWLKDFYEKTPPIEPVVPSSAPEEATEKPRIRFTLLSHPSCTHCGAAKRASEDSGVDVEVVESDESWELARQAGALRDFGSGPEPALPAWVAYVDDVPVKAWVGPSNAAGVRMMREFADGAAEGDPGAQDAQRHEAAKPGDPPAWCVRVHVTARMADGNSAIGTGSGVVVGRNLVLTNHHVASSAGRYRVKVGGEWRDARRVASDPRIDLALLSTSTSGATAVSVAQAVAGGAQVTTHGYASGVVYRSQDTVYRIGGSQHGASVDARSCPGESGGPVVNLAGELVGLIYGADVEDDPDGGRGLIVDLDSIKSFLKRQGAL